MIIYYINLDTATVRNNKFQTVGDRFQTKKFTRFRAIPRDEVPELVDKKMISMYNFGRDSHLARCGCFLSHIKLLEKIVQEIYVLKILEYWELLHILFRPPKLP